MTSEAHNERSPVEKVTKTNGPTSSLFFPIFWSFAQTKGSAGRHLLAI
jgi:hypothetical protein